MLLLSSAAWWRYLHALFKITFLNIILTMGSLSHYFVGASDVTVDGGGSGDDAVVVGTTRDEATKLNFVFLS